MDFNVRLIEFPYLKQYRAVQRKKDRVYGTGGRLLQKETTKYEYDAGGNLIKKITEEGIWKYLYYASQLMKSVIRPDGTEVEFTYDAFGRRMKKSFDGKTTRFLWDSNVILHEWEESEHEEVKSPITLVHHLQCMIPVARKCGGMTLIFMVR